MLNIYKAGGKYKKEDGAEYSVKTINENDKSKFIVDGWVTSLDSISAIEDAVFEEVEEKPKAKKKAKKVIKHDT